MTGKKLPWGSLCLLMCWTVLPTLLSYNWGFQDFYQDWASARNWWEGIAVYSPHSETVPRYLGLGYAALPEGKFYAIVATVKVNAHPPSAILFYVPLALLPYGLSYLTWNLLSIACLALTAGILANELKLTPSSWHLFWFGPLGLLGGPLFEQMFFGQSSAVLMALLALAWQAHRKGWQVREGCWLGVAVALKLFPLALLIIPFGSRRWRSLAAALGTMLVFVVLSMAWFGWDIWKEYMQCGLPETMVWGDLWSNASLAGFWRKLFVSQNKGLLVVDWQCPLGFWFGYVASSALVAVTTLGLIVARGRTSKIDSTYGIGICAMLLLSPTCWPNYFLMLLIPVALLWWDGGAGRYGRWMVAACFLLLFLPPSLGMLATCFVVPFLPSASYRAVQDMMTSVASPDATLSFLAAQTYGLVGLWALAAMQEVRALREQSAPPSDSDAVVGENRVAA